MTDNEWIEFRGDCADYVRNIHEGALKKFLDEIGLKDTFAYDYDYSVNKFIIYTCRPGVWIGKGGKDVERLKEILSEEVRENCGVEFKAMRGHFMTSEEKNSVDEFTEKLKTFIVESMLPRATTEEAYLALTELHDYDIDKLVARMKNPEQK